MSWPSYNMVAWICTLFKSKWGCCGGGIGECTGELPFPLLGQRQDGMSEHMRLLQFFQCAFWMHLPLLQAQVFNGQSRSAMFKQDRLMTIMPENHSTLVLDQRVFWKATLPSLRDTMDKTLHCLRLHKFDLPGLSPTQRHPLLIKDRSMFSDVNAVKLDFWRSYESKVAPIEVIPGTSRREKRAGNIDV